MDNKFGPVISPAGGVTEISADQRQVSACWLHSLLIGVTIDVLTMDEGSDLV